MFRRLFLCGLLVCGCYDSYAIEGSASGSRLHTIIYEPEGGEPAFGGWYDSELDVECSFRTSSDGVIRCLPRTDIVPATYSDAACSEPVYLAPDGTLLPDYVQSLELVAICAIPGPRVAEVRRVGDRVDATSVFYRRRDSSCQPLEPAAGIVIHRLEYVEPSTFVAAELREGTGGRIALDRIVADDGATQAYGLRDTGRSEACGPGGTAFDDLARAPCLPSSAARTMTGGPSCDETLAIHPPGAECLPQPELAYAEIENECGGTTGLEVFRVGPQLTGETFGPECFPGFEPIAFSTTAADDAVPWLTRELRGTGRVRRVVYALDGIEAPMSFYDTELDLRCDVSTGREERRCIPFAFPLSGEPLFADDACARRAATSCSQPWVRLPPEICGTIEEECFGRVGEAAPGAFRLNPSGACVPVDLVAYELEPVPWSRLARIEQRIEPRPES